jgi:hypothetical protein
LGRPTQGEWVIKPNEHVVFDVSYAPQTFEANGAYIEIASDDPDEPTVRIHLEGYGDAPVLSVTPLEFDYGLISIGCDNEERITIRNEGNMPLVIDDISQIVNNPPDILMEFGSLPPPPWIIDPQTEIDFLVSYIPTDVGWDRSEIIIESNDPVTPELTVNQAGDGDVEQWHYQRYEQSEISVLDILWVIDDSGSMNPYQYLLANQISYFFQAFLASAPDYNMSVITTSTPYLHGIINTTTPSPDTVLAGYWDLVDYYGGQWYSLCAVDWGTQLQDLGNTLSNRTTYGLDYPDPIEDTIIVTVNGQTTTEWIYDPATNSITFNSGHVPNQGQTIEIEYAVWGC